MARPQTWVNEDIRRFKQLIEDGLTADEAATEIGVNSSPLRFGLKRLYGLTVSQVRAQVIQDKSTFAVDDSADREASRFLRTLRLPTENKTIGRPRKTYEKTCPVCGMVFETKKTRQIYCSLKCTGMSPKRKKRVLTTKSKSCLCCGKGFHTNRPDQKYCSDDCRKQSVSEYKTVLTEISCPVCEKLFKPKQKIQRFCSRKCVYEGKKGGTPVCGRTRTAEGNYVKFESSYELVFLLYAKDHPRFYQNIERPPFSISYKVDNQSYKYYPDFLAEGLGGKNLLIELKSKRTEDFAPEKARAKRRAAQEWCQEHEHEYQYLKEDDQRFKEMCDYVSKNMGLQALVEKRRHDEELVIKKTCLRCGKQITRGGRPMAAYLRLKYCSVECRNPGGRRRSVVKHGKLVLRNPRLCPTCGKEFFGSNRKYCSKSCYTSSQKTLAEKMCLICGLQFMPKASDQVTCGMKCGIKYRAQSRMASHVPKPPKTYSLQCKYCGSIFESVSRKRKYCSADCYHEARKTHENRACIHCGSEFYNYTGKKMFCSKSCATKWRYSGNTAI